MPEFYIRPMFDGKIFFRDFFLWGAGQRPSPVSYAPGPPPAKSGPGQLGYFWQPLALYNLASEPCYFLGYFLNHLRPLWTTNEKWKMGDLGDIFCQCLAPWRQFMVAIFPSEFKIVQPHVRWLLWISCLSFVNHNDLQL